MSLKELSAYVVLGLRVILFFAGLIILGLGFATSGNASYGNPTNGLVQSTTGLIEIGIGSTFMLFAAGGASLVGRVLGFIGDVFRTFVEAIRGILNYLNKY